MSAFFCLFFPRGASLTWPRRVEIFCTFKQFIWNYFDPFSTCLSSSSFSKSKLLLSLLASEFWTSSCELGSHGEIRIHVWSAMAELPRCLVRYWVHVWAKHRRNTSPKLGFPNICGNHSTGATLGWSRMPSLPFSSTLPTPMFGVENIPGSSAFCGLSTHFGKAQLQGKELQYIWQLDLT